MVLKTDTKEIMLSSFDLSADVLMRCAIGVTTALHMLYPTNFLPQVILNDYDDFFGNSVTIEYKHYNSSGKGRTQ